MLIELNIQGLAVVDSARIAWGEGLNAVTGPTGAGKSLLARSIQVLLGGRIQPDWIRAYLQADWAASNWRVVACCNCTLR